jgi:integrase
VYRSNQRGSFVVERVVAGVPIRRASGTSDPDLFPKIQDMLDDIDEAGREDLARMLAGGQIKAVVLLHSFRRHGLSLKLSPERALPLKAAIDDWLKKAELAPKTAEDYGYALTAVLKGRPTATAADLPALLARHRERTKPRMFNLTRSAAQAFIRDTVAEGRYSELWAQVSRVRTRTVKRKKTSGLPPDVARTVAEQLGRYGAMWWTLCCTGMGNKEYWETPWEVEADRILIHGTKREDRDRVIPRIVTPVRPLCHMRTFETALSAAVAEIKLKGVTIYTGRRTWAHWLELAKIPPSRQQAYMGHAAGKVSDLYRQHEVEPYLAGDREALRAVAGEFSALKVMAG